MTYLRFLTFTFWNSYILELLRLETLTFSDVTLSDINVVWCYVLSQNPNTSKLSCFFNSVQKDYCINFIPLLPYTVKKVSHFPVFSRDVTDQTLPGREKLNYSRPGRVWSVTSRLRTGKWLTLFYSVLWLCHLHKLPRKSYNNNIDNYNLEGWGHGIAKHQIGKK